MADMSDKALSRILDSAIDTGIIALDAEGRVAAWNAGAERVLGWSEAEVRGQTLDRLFLEEDLTARHLASEMRNAATLGRGGREGWRVRKDGECIWAIGEMAPIRQGDDGTVAGYLKIVRGRTDWKKAEEGLQGETRTLSILQRAGAALNREPDLDRLVQTVTDAGGLKLDHITGLRR